MLMYVLSNVVGQRLQRHVVECQVSQRSELSETIRQSEAARQEGESGDRLLGFCRTATQYRDNLSASIQDQSFTQQFHFLSI